MERKMPLNDYAITCPKPENITDLPIDDMILIFKYLTPSERLRTTTVCKKWFQLVNEFFSNDHCLVLRTKDFSPEESFYKTFSDRLKTTKHWRSFSHVKINFCAINAPKNAANLSNVQKFIELIGNEVKCLEGFNFDYLRSAENWYNNNLYAKMPNLESLEVENANFLGDLSFVTNLKTIKLGFIQNFKILKYCRQIKGIKSFTAGSIRILKSKIDDESLMSFMEPNTKELLKQIIGSEQGDEFDSITLKSNFNFCSETKFSVDDVCGMKMENYEKQLSPNILSKFQNLKKLTLDEYRPFDLELVKYYGITHLVLSVYNPDVCIHPHDKLLQSFPDLESLSICFYPSQDDLFSIICQFMPKLKELFLSSFHGDPYLSIEAVLATNQYSLKDLPLLEKLDIQTEYKRGNGNHEWPVLPNLKELKIRGTGWQYLDEIFYAQIAKNSPKITKITINYYCSESMHNRFSKFFPLIEQLKLTHLSLPGKWFKGNDELEPNTELVTKISHHCKHLQELEIQDDIGLSSKQMLFLFSRIPSLNMIESEIRSGLHDYRHRKMTRNDWNKLQKSSTKNFD